MPRDPRQHTTAHRPLLRAGGGKRALSNVGGAATTWGEPALARALAGALAVRAGERDATLTHPFHAYPARLHPEVARALVALAAPRGIVLDPCCGSGTVLIESIASGRPAVGSDLSPLAVALARIKTRLTTERERKAIVDTAHAIARDAAAALRARDEHPVPRGEAPWFAPRTLAELAALRARIELVAPGVVRDAMYLLLSSVLVKVSRQASDSDARLAREKPDQAPGAALHFFARKSLELGRCLEALARAVPRGVPEPDVFEDDAAVLAHVNDGSVDAIVTSPPYANTYDYVAHHARRYAWLGLDARALTDGEIGAARWFVDEPEAGALRFARALASMAQAFSRVLRPGGIALVVMADGAAGDRALRADEDLARAIRGTALGLAARASQSRPAFDRSTARAFAREPKREHVIALRRDAGG